VLKNHPEWVAEAHSLGMSVNCWTVNNEEDIKAMIDLGVDCITTNEPLLVRKLLGDRELTL
ncbi:MAG: glycerophosphodiester phosphodiesterase, partial [Bacteroidales bacterium]|nr:glycerophosphodiester phosphodiesterase [Bacteroidales bacterium]